MQVPCIPRLLGPTLSCPMNAGLLRPGSRLLGPGTRSLEKRKIELQVLPFALCECDNVC